jgi:hypothetical protein
MATADCETSSRSIACWWTLGAPASERSQPLIVDRRPAHTSGPSRINSFRDDARHALRTRVGASANTPRSAPRCRSRISSPIATPTRPGAEGDRRNAPNGRFWIGKSQPGVLADCTQLRSRGSCVSLTGITFDRLQAAGCRLQACRAGLAAGRTAARSRPSATGAPRGGLIDSSARQARSLPPVACSRMSSATRPPRSGSNPAPRSAAPAG